MTIRNQSPFQPSPIRTLVEFYARMASTREARVRLTADVLAGREPDAAALELLRAALDDLAALPGPGGEAALGDDAPRVLSLGQGRDIRLSLGYEIGELRKDLCYLVNGEQALLDYLAGLHPGFAGRVRAVAGALRGLSFRCLISDRDGTVNNYCGRYRSSVQSAYNAVFLTRFARARVECPVLLTSAPLAGGGIADVSCAPEGAFILAGSKGREFTDREGRVRRMAVDPARRERLDRFNACLGDLLVEPGREVFGLIGSGLQFKFGQTTVARQDISGSVTPQESLAFLGQVRDLVRESDPRGEVLRIEDTGLDIEILLTIADSAGGLKDFDKGDGVRFLARELGVDLGQGPHLVCGDTASDLPMLGAVLEATDDVEAVFVTTRPELGARVRELCAKALVVDRPDVLVAALGALA